jgi:hypothetical protein
LALATPRCIGHIVGSLICDVGRLFPLWGASRQTIAGKIVSTVAAPA